LFEAYQLAGDSVFRQFIRELEVKWESGDIATLTPEELMQKAEGRFKVMVEKKVWAKPTKEEADLMAMVAARIEANPAEVVTKSPGSGKGKGAGKNPRENVGEWEWKNHTPAPGEPKEKTFKGRVYVTCKFHKGTQWVLKDGHSGGCRNDPNFVKDIDKMTTPAGDKEVKQPTKKALQYANALMAAMEQEESHNLQGVKEEN
jgi:hypothetical protein